MAACKRFLEGVGLPGAAPASNPKAAAAGPARGLCIGHLETLAGGVGLRGAARASNAAARPATGLHIGRLKTTT